MPLVQYRTSRKTLVHLGSIPQYIITRHLESERCDVTMSRSKGSYYISDAIPCKKGGKCNNLIFPYRVTHVDNSNIEKYMTAYFQRIHENKKKQISKGNDSDPLSGNSG
jgi:hypothetical protein